MKIVAILLFSCSVLTLLAQNKSVSKNQDNKAEIEKQRSISYTFIEANREKLIGNYDKAKQLFAEVIKKDPNNDAAYFELAKIAAQNETFDDAIDFAELAIAIDKSNRYYYFLASEIYVKLKEVEKATKVMQRALKAFPEDVEVYYELASQYIAIEKWKKAREIYQMALARFGENPEIRSQVVRIFLSEKDYKNAEIETKRLIELNPKETMYWELLGEIYLAQKKIEEAKKCYEQMLEVDPFNGYVHFLLGEIYIEQGNEDKAFSSIKNGFLSPNVEIDNKVKILLNYYEISQVKLKYLPDAYELCELLIKVHKNDPKGFAVYGDFLLRDRKNAKAREMFKKSVELSPDKFLIWNEIILLDAQLNDTTALLADTKKALDLFPNMPDFYMYRGIALSQQKQFEDAAEVFEAGKGVVVDNEPMKAQFYSNLGDVYHELSWDKQSDNAYEKSLKLMPDNAFVLNNYSYYLSLRNEQLDKAERMSRKAIELEPTQASFLDTYGWILYQQNKFEEAKTYLDKALNFGGMQSGTIVEHYGDVLYKLNDKIGALEYWKKAAELGDGSEFLKKKIAEEKLYE